MSTLQCTVVVPDTPDAPSTPVTGTLRIRLVDVGRQDVAGTVLASDERADVTLSPGGRTTIPLQIDPGTVSGMHPQLSVEAHLDRSGSGETSVGDYRTMSHVSVDPGDLGSDTEVIVPVRRVD